MHEEFGPGTVHHLGQHKWAELAAWGMLDDETKKKVVLRKIDRKIKRREFKIEMLKDKVETLKMIKQAIGKK